MVWSLHIKVKREIKTDSTAAEWSNRRQGNESTKQHGVSHSQVGLREEETEIKSKIEKTTNTKIERQSERERERPRYANKMQFPDTALFLRVCVYI